MLRISQLKLHYTHDEAALRKKIAKQLHIREDEIISYKIRRKSVDARKKEDILYIYTVEVEIRDEKVWLRRHPKEKNVDSVSEKVYKFKISGTEPMTSRPVIVGSGPAGLFCALMLACHGFRPIVLERGEAVEQRLKSVQHFWQSGALNTESNVQFGEGGAGTFSDGKLNTLVKDKYGRNTQVLKIFAEAGAGEEITYMNKPHIGTDVLVNVVRNIRQQIIDAGGEVRFCTKLTGIKTADGRVTGAVAGDEIIPTEVIVLAPGHSARDTFEMLYEQKIVMMPKPFAIGVRIEHPQAMINESQYGRTKDPRLPAADYKLTYHTSAGRSVYTFCMCPGGYVVNASSEAGRTVVNGMSYRSRDSANANSAVIVNVAPEDFDGTDALAGVRFQRRWEEACYAAAGRENKIPVQLYEDFKNNRCSKAYGNVRPVHCGDSVFADLNRCLPPFVCESLKEGIDAFGSKIRGFDRPDALLSGIETRTSSPLRIERDEHMESSIKGLYPCGEGAGYAGGITSAAMDGIKIAEAVAAKYRPIETGD